jgi:hypothetical protein
MKKIVILAVLFQFLICFTGNLPEVETDSLKQKIIFQFNVYNISAGPAMYDNPHRDKSGEIIEELRNLGAYKRFFWNEDETYSQCVASQLFYPIEDIQLYINDFQFESIQVINKNDPDAEWRLSGQAVLQEYYSDGVFIISMKNTPKIYLKNCSFTMTVPLPRPHGYEGLIEGAGFGFIDYELSDSEWIKIIDNELGKLRFTFNSASAPIQGEYGEYDIALTIRSSDR